jgi:hypothetical protein
MPHVLNRNMTMVKSRNTIILLIYHCHKILDLIQLKGLYRITFPNYIVFFYKCFQNLNKEKEYDWIRTPSAASLKYNIFDWLKELIEIRSDSSMKM